MLAFLCRAALLAVLSALCAPAALAQRPVPYPVLPPPQVDLAVQSGTRTLAGAPGPAYWQNRAAYTLTARFDPETAVLSGTGTIAYSNHSPDSLRAIVLKLRQNVHAPGVPRNRPVAVTGGVTLSRLAIGGREAEEADGRLDPGQYAVDGTVLTLALPAPLAPGATATIETAWSYPVPPSTGAFRQGQDGEVVYLGYWYPQVAVYDDVSGWHTDPYLGAGEHYMGYADYDLTLDMPAGWLVWATGTLQNPDAVLTERTRERLDRARQSDDATVAIVRAGDRGQATQPGTDGRLVWRFRAENVRDVAVSTSAAYVWDARAARVDQDEDGTDETVLINAMYRPGTASWARSAEFVDFAIEHLSETLFPYPYPAMTAVEGLIGGGMEYPMMTLIGGARTDQSLFSVTYHETAHMWFPMVVGSNEKSFTWMDEGLTSFNTNEGLAAFFDGSAPDRPVVDAWSRARQSHYALAGTGHAIEPMRHNDRFRVGAGTRDVDPVGGSARTIASYSTPAVLLHNLRGVVGEDAFWAAYREYGRRWRFKHPTPYDLFNTFEDRLGQDLDWLWTPTLFETWTVDHAVARVEATAGGVEVTVEDHGLAPMPAPVEVTYADGRTERQSIPVATWLAGATSATLTFPAGAVTRVEIDPDGYTIDVDRADNVWEREPPANGQ